MEAKVEKEHKKNIELWNKLKEAMSTRRLEGAEYREFSEQPKDSWNESMDTEEGNNGEIETVADPDLPPLSPLDEEDPIDDTSGSESGPIDKEFKGYPRALHVSEEV